MSVRIDQFNYIPWKGLDLKVEFNIKYDYVLCYLIHVDVITLWLWNGWRVQAAHGHWNISRLCGYRWSCQINKPKLLIWLFNIIHHSILNWRRVCDLSITFVLNKICSPEYLKKDFWKIIFRVRKMY